MKIKSQVTGKRFSKKEVFAFEFDEEATVAEKLKAYFSQYGHNNGEGGYTMGRSFTGHIDDMVEVASRYLRKVGLPDAPKLFWSLEHPDEWRAQLPESETFKAGCDLDHHVIKQKGFEHDSPEGLAARIVVAAHRMRTTNRPEDALRQAFELGRLTQLVHVYSVVSNDSRSGGRKPKKKAWAEWLAAQLVADYPDATHAERWEAIPDNPDTPIEYGAADIYRDGDAVVMFDGKEDTLRKSTFRTEYLTPANSKRRQP